MAALPEIQEVESRLLVQYVIGCFIRGRCVESLVSDLAVAEKTFDRFVDILEIYVNASRRNRIKR